jgi:hypothetical protein
MRFLERGPPGVNSHFTDPVLATSAGGALPASHKIFTIRSSVNRVLFMRLRTLEWQAGLNSYQQQCEFCHKIQSTRVLIPCHRLHRLLVCF